MIGFSGGAKLYFNDLRKFGRLELLPKKWVPGANTPFDPIASAKAQKLGLEVVVMNGKKIKNLQNYLSGRPFRGTIIS